MDSKIPKGNFSCNSPEDTFELGARVGRALRGGEVLLLKGELGTGKTLFSKGVVSSLGFDVDEVTSPSFALVNLYRAKFDVYHIDLWRIDKSGDAVFAVGLEEILEDKRAVVLIEWADRLNRFRFGRGTVDIEIAGTGDESRTVKIES